MLFVAAGDIGRLKIGTDDTFRRAGLLDFGDDRRPIGGNLVANRPDKVAGRRLRSGFGLHNRQRFSGTGCSNLFVFGRDDLVEDVAHARPPSRWVH
ncbi:hypothetical protein SDC9_190941 [bioreactor metagenome]|uniref:Uncharacterized protein n=1 Tax=bioreactor metagenome TaxID=1076179 RepID=A0A645HY01_9ZZZZ